MFVGIAKLTLSIPASGSLKDKRQVIRKVIDRTRAKFNVSAAEVEANDLWQKAVLGFSVIGNDRRFVGECLDTILHFVEEMYVAPVIDRQVEILPFDEHSGGTRTLAEAEAEADSEPDWDEDADG
jgi:uncharacterized protein